jgi:hypothetical protein
MWTHRIAKQCACRWEQISILSCPLLCSWKICKKEKRADAVNRSSNKNPCGQKVFAWNRLQYHHTHIHAARKQIMKSRTSVVQKWAKQSSGFNKVYIILTFRGPCIVIYLTMKANEMHYFSYLFDKVLYMFRTCPLSIIRSISTMYTCNRYLSF